MKSIYLEHRQEFIQWSRSSYRISEDEARDYYQDVIAIFFEKVMSGSLTDIDSSLKTYLFGIGKNQIRQFYQRIGREEKNQSRVTEHYTFIAESPSLNEHYIQAKSITEQAFKSIDSACKKLLQLFYFQQKSMKEIAEIMGYKSEEVSRTSKKRCLDKIRKQTLNHG